MVLCPFKNHLCVTKLQIAKRLLAKDPHSLARAFAILIFDIWNWRRPQTKDERCLACMFAVKKKSLIMHRDIFIIYQNLIAIEMKYLHGLKDRVNNTNILSVLFNSTITY